MEDLSRIEKFERDIAEVDFFIDAPTSYIYDQIEDPTQYEIIECLRAIIYNNRDYLERKKNRIAELKKTIEIVTNHPPVVSKNSTSIPQELISREEKRDLSEYIKLILFSNFDSETTKKLSSLSREDKIRIKLFFLNKINQIKKAIKETILRNPTSDIKKLQDDLSTFELAIEFISEVEQEEQIESSVDLSNVIITPNGKNSSYLLDDILYYKENRKEIKNAIDKIVDGYFLMTKDIRSLEGYKQDNLYEYKHPNGIRILYVAHKGTIFICSLFYKDKQKSTKIEKYYEEAIRRFNNSKDYLLANINNPDFYIEQDELLGQIYSVIDDLSYTKKVGE